jgi:hypothetical protein
VNTSVLDVLGDEVTDHGTATGDGIHLNLLGPLDVLGDDNGVILGNLNGLVKVGGKIVLRVHGVHGGTRKHVGGADKHWVLHAVAEVPGLINAGEFLPLRLVDAESVEHPRELKSIFCAINHLRRGTENLDVAPIERKGDVVGGLTTHGDQDTSRVLELVDVQHSLDTDVLEVEAVGFVVIGAHRFRVVQKWGQYVSIKYCCDVG